MAEQVIELLPTFLNLANSKKRIEIHHDLTQVLELPTGCQNLTTREVEFLCFTESGMNILPWVISHCPRIKALSITDFNPRNSSNYGSILPALKADQVLPNLNTLSLDSHLYCLEFYQSLLANSTFLRCLSIKVRHTNSSCGPSNLPSLLKSIDKY